MQDMWDRWVGFGVSAGMTGLMRASFGDILAAPSGREAILHLIDECSAVATAAGFPPRQPFIESVTTLFSTVGSPIKASMLRDIERGAPTEGEHALGELTARPWPRGRNTDPGSRTHPCRGERGRTCARSRCSIGSTG